MSDDAHSCPSCGARVPAGADTCDLCGTPVAESSDPPPDESAESASDSSQDDPASESDAADAESSDSLYCNECGWENPVGANYCSQCGSELQDVTPASGGEPAAEVSPGTRAVTAELPSGSGSSTASPSDQGSENGTPQDEQAEMGTQILMVVGAAVALVVGLFFATQWSQQYEWGGDSSTTGPASNETTQQAERPGGDPSGPSGAGGDGSRSPASPQAAAQAPADLATLVDQLSGPVEGPVADQIDSLETAIEGASGDRRRQLRAQLVQLYIGAGVPGRAARIQTSLAEQTGRVEDRRRAANLLYKWMRQVERQDGRARVADVARYVAEAYATVVDERPDDLDARTRMGEAYMLTNSPMKGIRAINQVLADDSTFVPARFQKGLALLQINRLDQAVSQFQRVMEYASQNDPFYQQAKRAIEVIREQAGAEGGTGAPSSGR